MPELVTHFIDGHEVPSRDGRTFDSVSPATGEVLAQVSFGGPADVDRAAQAAAAAFEAGPWRDLAPAQRGVVLRRLAALIVDNADRIAQVEARDAGKPITQAREEALSAASLLDYFSGLAEHPNGSVYPQPPGYFSHTRREPYGVVGAISPWNYPFVLACWKTAPALVVGNSVVLKMAEQAPLSTSLLAQLSVEAGIPPGVFNVVHGDGPVTGAAIAAHPGIPKITFTGSTETGKAILRAAAEHVKSVHLELGGKTPNIVFEDADLERALAGSLFTSFANAGQICTSGSRLLVAESIADEFLAALVDRAGRIRVGDPLDERTQIGPLISAEQHARVRGYIDSGVRSGASAALASPAPGPGHDLYVSPTVFTQVDPSMPIAREEIFGPVLSVMTFTDEAQAVAIANDVMYGLAATAWTGSLDRALRLTDRLEAGIIWVNCAHYGPWNTPYEGHKLSGLGEDLGVNALATFTKLKVAHVQYGGDPMAWA
jgi:acyl-CoA reductase-like NAD-dependent aldehyde dehydrogenase